MNGRQLDLLDPARPLVRRTDPETSAEGARSIVGKLNKLQADTLAALRRNRGMTANELAHVEGQPDPRIFNRRLGELVRKLKVRKGKGRKCGRTGRRCITWWPV